MEKNLFLGHEMSRLGFGAMRLPVDAETGKVDVEETKRMVDFAYKNGVNYFDTAFSYHGGESEIVMGEILKEYPRDSWYLASKMPGHEINPNFNPKSTFELQLKKCGVDYFDFYMLHNVYENSLGVYTDENIGVVEYLIEQKKAGRIKHLGFSTHARFDTLKKFVEEYGDNFEFVQIQLNYLDWTVQDAKEKYELFTNIGMPIIVMEPCRGGKLANLPGTHEQMMKELRPDDSVASWAFGFIRNLPNVKVILSGMTTYEQVEDNVKTFTERSMLNENEMQLLSRIAAEITDIVPCTSCRYCCKECPAELNIPLLLQLYTDAKLTPTMNLRMSVDSLPEEKHPANCVGCGNCTQVCPQSIDVPSIMKEFSDILQSIPSWVDVSKERAKQSLRYKSEYGDKA